MNVSGSIATNSRASVDEIKKRAEMCGVEFYSQNDQFYIKTSSITFVQQLVVEVELSETAVKFNAFIPELSGYVFLALVALGILFRMLSIGIWSIVLLFAIALLLGIRVRYDKRLFQLMDQIVPKSARLVPEQAGSEHLKWISNPNVCPACGTPRNEYSSKCTSCGLVLGKGGSVKKIVNHSHTGEKSVDISYDYTSE
ncbi:MAG: hypothetical protein PHU27_06620 [Salinivirgaceae bacterium]|nr:hypothetical protein [Salinivirgaceae bacterium]MDY0281390.1 hypothetical protein [Salinivirgaceae bacterium]